MFSNHFYASSSLINYQIRHRRRIDSEYKQYSHLLDQEVNLNDIIIHDVFYAAIETRNFINYINAKPLINTYDLKQYFEFIIDDFEFKKEKWNRIRVTIAEEALPAGFRGGTFIFSNPNK